MQELTVDLGFGIEAKIVVPVGASMEKIKEECLAQTGENLFCVKYETSKKLEHVPYKEW